MAIFTLLSCVGRVSAAPLESIAVTGSGACPAPDRVARAIFELTSANRRRVPARASVQLADGGDAFTVVVRAGDERGRRVYSDAERDCERRVRIAAVFAVTTLLPPELAAPEPPPAAPPPPPSPAPKAAYVPLLARAPLLRLELGVFGEIGGHFAEPTRVLAWGGELGGAFGRGPLAITLALAYAPRTKLTAPELDADLARITAALGGRVRLIERPIDLALDAGAIGALQRLRGTSVLTPAQDEAVELGFRVALVVTPRQRSGVAPFAAVRAELFPASRAIAIAPAGVVAHTPLLYGGVTLGVALGL